MSGAYGYARQPGPHSVTGFVGHTALGAAAGAGMGAAGGAAGHGLQAVGSKVLCKISSTGCFVAGTEVLLADGSSKAIEEVETDDEVLAYDPETEQTEKRRVVRAMVHQDKPTYDVVTHDGDIVTATSEHPFMVEGRGWVDQLHKDDLLVRPDGSTIAVLELNSTDEVATVYNSEVEGLHDYYVMAGDNWLLVHNSNGCGFVEALGNDDFESPEGLIYESGSKQGHRIAHVLTHTVPDRTKNYPLSIRGPIASASDRRRGLGEATARGDRPRRSWPTRYSDGQNSGDEWRN